MARIQEDEAARNEPTAEDPPSTVEHAFDVLRRLALSLAPSANDVPEIAAPAADSEGDRTRRMVDMYRSLVERIPVITFMASLDGARNELYVSPQIEAMLGFSQAEWLSDPILWYRQLHPEDRFRCEAEFARGCLTGGPFRLEFRAVARDGHVVWLHGEATLVRDEGGRPLYLQGVAYDITESKRAEAAEKESSKRIQAALEEKEILLQEIHHRVKNNLQVISSLLKLQSESVTDPAALEILAASRNRVQSMALVHERLYRSDDLSRVDAPEYVKRLVELLIRSSGPITDRVRVHADVEPIPLSVDQAVPVGLLLNELVSNSLKHGFPRERTGELRIELRRDEDALLLTVADDGVGIESLADVESGGTLGLRLVRGFARQLDGELDCGGDGGARFTVRFPAADRGAGEEASA